MNRTTEDEACSQNARNAPCRAQPIRICGSCRRGENYDVPAEIEVWGILDIGRDFRGKVPWHGYLCYDHLMVLLEGAPEGTLINERVRPLQQQHVSMQCERISILGGAVPCARDADRQLSLALPPDGQDIVHVLLCMECIHDLKAEMRRERAKGRRTHIIRTIILNDRR
jgi:hypothetical protein